MIAVIRIRGLVDVSKDVEETLNRLRLRKKFSCIVVKEKPEIIGMIEKVKDYVTYGEINEETFKELLKKRGRLIDKTKKIEIENVIEKFLKEDKKLEELNIKPFFRLHPPRGGLKSIKKHFPKGDLGYRGDKINDLIKRML